MGEQISDLEFSADTRVSGQELLFEKTSTIPQKRGGLLSNDDFYEHGYTLLDDVADVSSAQDLIMQFIQDIDEKKLPLYARFVNKIQLAKVDLIPVCHDIIPRTFQALHFDMGQPIVSSSTQSMYTLLALYKPKTSTASSAKTRVLSIKKLLSQKKFGAKEQIEQRLIHYAQNHGDGWKAPNVVNTLRLACFARIVDAASGRNELTQETDKTTGQWFDYDGNASVHERAFFSASGLDLSAAEEQINIKPGQLLIVDNMRCAHGRIGPRQPKEIYQFLFGVKSATPSMIDDFRTWLASQFAENQ